MGVWTKRTQQELYKDLLNYIFLSIKPRLPPERTVPKEDAANESLCIHTRAKPWGNFIYQQNNGSEYTDGFL